MALLRKENFSLAGNNPLLTAALTAYCVWTEPSSRGAKRRGDPEPPRPQPASLDRHAIASLGLAMTALARPPDKKNCPSPALPRSRSPQSRSRPGRRSDQRRTIATPPRHG